MSDDESDDTTGAPAADANDAEPDDGATTGPTMGLSARLPAGLRRGHPASANAIPRARNDAYCARVTGSPGQ